VTEQMPILRTRVWNMHCVLRSTSTNISLNDSLQMVTFFHLQSYTFFAGNICVFCPPHPVIRTRNSVAKRPLALQNHHRTVPVQVLEERKKVSYFPRERMSAFVALILLMPAVSGSSISGLGTSSLGISGRSISVTLGSWIDANKEKLKALFPVLDQVRLQVRLNWI
jgi:hypothetical protein